MIMVQKPVHMLSTPTYHRRHPSAPPTVLVQPTRIPGLLSLSKPPSVTPPRPNQHQTHHNRHPRSTHNNKPKSASTARQSLPPLTAVQPLFSDASNNPPPVAQLPTRPPTLPATPSPQEKGNNRRHNSQHHQGSPPNPSHLPSQAEVNNNPNPPTRPYSLHTPQHNSFDLFLVSSESESDNPPSTPTKANPPVRPAPKLASRPTGKLARRRQNVGGVPSTPTPSKALSVPRPTAQPHSWDNRSLNLSRSVPTLSSMQSNGAIADVFPICDDLTDVEDDDDVFAPSTPVRSKSGNTTRQPAMYDDGPRTAPISTPRSGFPFNSKPVPTVTPERKRQHVRSPSEGIFNLSMDEDSALSSPSDGGLKAPGSLSARRRIVSAASSGKRDFWASSKFQNSPSPDVLPVPAFKAQVALQ
ncbi:hypothetical protein EDB92DRAFT_1794095 [Lactarius akahatsu]|uniref:Uncharacterized protein n=1 Tax=Lactarius akahatsu TaxID=416441 RepID=A0AAD4LLL1_9AGAM|nr:hypothetical protein EDB92DRAFT_1794095 [Lactarius akahatsu]